tara:strand:+ start:1341 stop:1529 length:189 start_codon:yes stop_codon:yes gene_type:complete
MVTLQLTKNQGEVLLSLLDIATKSGGLNVAEAAVFFSKLIEQQNAEAAEPSLEVVEDDDKDL